MRKIKDILRLKLDARLSHERVAASLGISKGVVAKKATKARNGWCSYVFR